MHLLIVTQTVDKNDPVLGFFHRWIEEFAKHFEHIHVIALQTAEYDLPENVTVHSLGKEKGAGKLQRLYTLYSILYTLRHDYDAVFVHMNPEYIVLAGWLWRLAGKKIGLWYNHTVGSVWLKIAQPFTSIIFHTSPYAYTARYKNAKRMPAGIDTDVFKPRGVKKIPRSVYFQGRVAPAKKVHILLEAFAMLHEKGEANRLTIVGPEDASYATSLKEKYRALITSGAIAFLGPREYTSTPELYESHAVSVNLTDRGNYDKTVLESLACDTPVVVLSDAFSDIIPKTFQLTELSSEVLVEKLSYVLRHPTDITSLRSLVVERHSLPHLAHEMRGALS